MQNSRPDILTITPNPSLDLLHETGRVVWDDANRVCPPRRRPGGQGINVARAARALGGTAHVMTPLGGRTGAELRELLEEEGMPCTVVEAPGETRIFPAIRETSTGRSLLINPRGPTFTPDDVEVFRHAAIRAITGTHPTWVACCGSLPPGFPADFYASLKGAAADVGALYTVDCDGEALRQAAEAGCDLLVPNRYEVERLTGSAVSDVKSAARAASGLSEVYGGIAVVTLGSEGAVISGGPVLAHVRVKALNDGMAVGAGDALLAGVLLALVAGATLEMALAKGVAAGTSVLSGTGGDLVPVEVYRRLLTEVEIRDCGRP